MKLWSFIPPARKGLLPVALLLLLNNAVLLFAQRGTLTQSVTIQWQGIQTIRINDLEEVSILAFDNAIYPNPDNLPVWYGLFPVKEKGMTYRAELFDIRASALPEAESGLVSGSAQVGRDFQVEATDAVIRKEHYTAVSIIPIRKMTDGSFERLDSFAIRLTLVPVGISESLKKVTKGDGLLANGDLYKVRVSKSGIYRIDHSELSSMGMAGANAANLQLYGMGGGMLPELAGAPRPDGLTEIAIQVEDGGDGSLDQGDYILFYGEGAGKWQYDSLLQRFVHQKHLYDDHNYYFLTKGPNQGMRIQSQPPPAGTPTHTVTSFQDYGIYENDTLNLMKSGKVWFGEKFDIRTTYSFSFSFPNIDPLEKVEVLTSLAARSAIPSAFNIQSGTHSTSASMFNVPPGYNSQYAFQAITPLIFYSSGNTVPVTITYNKPLSSSEGWLDYILVNLRRSLKFTGNQMHFREARVTGSGNIALYELSQSNAATKVWDITDPFRPEGVTGTLSSTTFSFSSDATFQREFIALNNSGHLKPDIIGKVAQQNLKGTLPVKMVIVSHPDFLASANRLAALHQKQSGLSCLIVTPGMIYNEFSSGKQDPSAIRDFMKMLYDRATTPQEVPSYLLLFGDGSYDNKNRVDQNTNFIPTFQSEESLHPAYSFVTDDFYGLMDDNEGLNGSGHLDLGVGRIPVATPSEAVQMVDKIERYMADNLSMPQNTVCTGGSNARPLADWRNIICIIADDEDGNLHVDQAEMLTNYCNDNYGVYNINKIYIDAYQQVSISGGHRYPDVNEAINKQLEKGALIVNYIGHGGELGWAHERILRIEDILSWTNAYNLPLLLTSTCEFSRFDDPMRRSAGEYAYLNPNGGGIALFTTTRLAFASTNYAFNTAFYQNIFKKTNDEYGRLGDAFMWSKIGAGSVASNRNMVILGDPALMLAYPKHQVLTTHINETPISQPFDTLKALSKVTVKGMIADQNGQLLSGFNGILYPVVYDKKTTFSTLANDQGSYPKNFWMQKNALYKGKVTIKDGFFSFSFMVPKDISYAYGFGKISYYGENGTEDAHGFFDRIVVGGTSADQITDTEGPTIRLFLNDSSFVFGGTTDANPVIFALVRDEHGINTTGGGIGHDIVATLDGNTNKSIILNDYYESDLDSWNSGSITYGLSGLDDGNHHLHLKVWDILNNSSEAYTEFVVASSTKPVLAHVLNYPNPFTTYTEFWFEHNQPCCDLDAMVEVFTISGKLVKSIRRTISTVGYRAEPISWDGLDDYGDRLARGVYVYKVTIRNKDLQSTEKFEKLVILR